MPAVNHAYRVLSDPARRVAYDQELRRDAGGPHRPNAGPAADRPAPGHPAGERFPEPVRASRFPWRGFTIATAVAVIGVAAASVFARPTTTVPPDGILHPGSCVRIEPNTDAREVMCTGTEDLVVRQLVPIGAGCPLGTQGHRDHQGQGTACVEPAPDT